MQYDSDESFQNLDQTSIDRQEISLFTDEEQKANDLISSYSDWDVAVRYHEIKSKIKNPVIQKRIQKISVYAIIERAKKILGSLIHTKITQSTTLEALPVYAEQPELDIDKTLDHSLLTLARGHIQNVGQEIWLNYKIRRVEPLVLCVDTSLSMTGEKLALTAVALCVVLLQFPEDPIGIIAFETDAKVLKKPQEQSEVSLVIAEFLDVPCRGYTHLEEGLTLSLRLVRQLMMNGVDQKPPATVLLTDGKYTAGQNPVYLAPKFPYLAVLKIGSDKSSLLLCRQLAKQGNGSLREVDDLFDLPKAMFTIVKELLRGRSSS